MTLAPPQAREPGAGAAPRWGRSFAVVAALHGAVLIGLIFWVGPAAAPEPPPPPPAIAVDMAPLPAQPPAPTPKQTVQHPTPPTAEALRPPEPAPLPRLPIVASAAVALPTEPPRPEHPTAVPTAAPPPPGPAPPAAAPPRPAPPPSNALPTWQGLVLGRLERFKRYPDAARFHHQEGVVWLRFAMNRDGKVVSASIDKSSGVAALDAEALDLVRRAQPLPKPPAEVPGETLELVAPIEFTIARR